MTEPTSPSDVETQFETIRRLGPVLLKRSKVLHQPRTKWKRSKETNWEVKEQRPEGLQIAPRYHVTWIMFKNRNLPSASRPSVNDHSHGKRTRNILCPQTYWLHTDISRNWHNIFRSSCSWTAHDLRSGFLEILDQFLAVTTMQLDAWYIHFVMKVICTYFCVDNLAGCGKIVEKTWTYISWQLFGSLSSALLIVTPMHFSAKSMQSVMLKDLW